MRLRKKALDYLVSPRIIRDTESRLIVICRFPLGRLLLVLLEVAFHIWLREFLHRFFMLGESVFAKGNLFPIFQKFR